MRLHRDQSHHEERCLHKRRKAKSHDLLAPARESLGHSSRKAEEIQTAYSNLREQDATSLDICKEALDHTVAKADEDEEIKQDIVLTDDGRLVDSQYIQSQVLNVEIHSDCLVRQIFCEGVLEVHRESEQFDGYSREKVHRQQSVKKRQYLLFDVQASHRLILNCRIEDRYDKSCQKQSPSEQIEEVKRRFYPIKVEQVCPDLRHQCEEICQCLIDH